MQYELLSKDSLVPRSTYVRELRSELPAEVFEPATSRLLLVPVYLGLIVAATMSIGAGWLPWFVWPAISIVIGIGFACMTFIAHEAMHGGIVRGRFARHTLGFIGFLPFTVSPLLWAAWHDRVHHATANAVDDPDSYPTLAEYQNSRGIRFMIDKFSPGGRRWRGVLSLLLGFTGQSIAQLVHWRRYFTPRTFVLALLETAAALAVWVTVAWLVGFVPFLFVYVAPLLIANTIVMAFILTNHGLSPRVEINDPLVSGLSVTAPRWIEWITLHFGYHVEHHVFPSMSSRHARRVRELLRGRWPHRYQSMPWRAALARLHRTARVYKDAATLVDPRTGHEHATLMPG